MKKLFTLLAIIYAFVTPVFPADNNDKDKEKRYADIRKMMEASRATKMFDQMKDGIKANALKMIQNTETKLEDLEMTDEVKKLYDEFAEKSIDRAMKLVNMEELINDMVPYYDKYVSNEDIKTITAFYETPAGKRFLDAAPKITMDYMAIMMDKMGGRMKQMQAEIEKSSKEFAEKLIALKEKQKKEKGSKETK